MTEISRPGGGGGGGGGSGEPEILTLAPVSGPTLARIVVRFDQPGVIGRQSTCDVQLPDPSVSRVHAGLEWKRGRWFITDRMSRAGTFLNSLKMEPDSPTPLREGDILGIGPWRLRIHLGSAPLAEGVIESRMADSSGKVEAVQPDELLSRTQKQLGLVLDFASAIQEARTEEALAEIVARAASQGSGYTRAALVKPAMGVDRIAIVVAVDNGNISTRGFPISSSLIRTAASGQVARLTSSPVLQEAHSIVAFGIRSAICAPLVVGGTIAAYLYVDNGDREGDGGDEAAAFLAAIARLGALALTEFSRRALEDRHRQLEADLTAARQAQERLMPPSAGRLGKIRYATCSRPGRLVAGDLFEVVELKDGRVGVFLGDVAGKGVGAAVLMAAAQTELRAALKFGLSLTDAIGALNKEIIARAPVGEFVSLFVGIIDPAAHTLEFVDAGHGYWLHREGSQLPRRMEYEGGLVLGVEEDFQYRSERIRMAPGDRIIVFSDGVIEQHDPAGATFGFASVISSLEGTQDEGEDVRVLLDRLETFAQSEDLSDDVTIASIHLDP